MPAKGNKHYGYLLDDPQVNRWYENVARGSRITADVYLRRFGNVMEDKNLSPHELLKIGQGDLFNLLLDLISEMEGVRRELRAVGGEGRDGGDDGCGLGLFCATGGTEGAGDGHLRPAACAVFHRSLRLGRYSRPPGKLRRTRGILDREE